MQTPVWMGYRRPSQQTRISDATMARIGGETSAGIAGQASICCGAAIDLDPAGRKRNKSNKISYIGGYYTILT
jgi:hypothetical protein